MVAAIDDLQRFGLKLFLEPAPNLDLRAFIPIFHRWIQTNALDQLLIDVADYTHLSDGPSVLLAGHEGNYAIDQSEGRIGLYYYRKQPASGSLGERLVAVGQSVLRAGALLEQDESLGAGCRFRGDEIQFVANDRLRAPVGPQTTNALRSPLAAFGRRMFGGQSSDQLTEGDEADRIRLTLHATTSQTLKTLLKNLS